MTDPFQPQREPDAATQTQRTARVGVMSEADWAAWMRRVAARLEAMRADADSGKAAQS